MHPGLPFSKELEMFPTPHLECWVTLFRLGMERNGAANVSFSIFLPVRLHRNVCICSWLHFSTCQKFISGKQTTGSNRTWLPAATEIMRVLLSCLYQWSTNPSLFAVTCNFTVGAGLSSSWGQWPECPAMKQRYYGTMGVVLCTESELFQEKALKTRCQTMYSSCGAILEHFCTWWELSIQ